MQGMDVTVFHHGARGGNQRLADHLPAKYALPADLRAATTEQVAFQRFQVENLEKIINGRVHRRDPC
ncbi:hypothetical protein ROS1_47750 [Roseibium sp. ROS1]